MSILNVEHLTHGFGDRAIFEDVSFRLLAGEHIGLVGANGEGKSTFMNIVTGKLMPDEGKVEWAKNVRTGYLDQNSTLQKGMTIESVLKSAFAWLFEQEERMNEICDQLGSADPDQMDAMMEELGVIQDMLTMHDFYVIDSKVEEVARALGLLDLGLDHDVSDLSGGQRMKVLLAKLLLEKPDILLLDEPTNHLDLDAINWLEEFLINFENTVIVVSHDRYFLNKVCTNIADIDYGKIQLYAGNYDFWYESSQLLVKQMKEANKKKEEKIKELQDFISRFSANASKSKQATSRKRALEKIQLDEIRPSSRKYPYIDFRPSREIGNEVLSVEGITKTIDGVKVLDNVSFIVGHDDKIAFVGGNELAKTTLFKILTGEMEPDSGSYKWGVTTSQSYFPKDNTEIFDTDLLIVDWLTQYSEIKDATYVRGFLGRMLFAGEDGTKKMRVLSGGEKVRVLLSRMMIMATNVLILDEPTDHLDMESITALNNGLIKFPGVILFTSHDHQVVQTTANRIIEFLPDGTFIDKVSTYDEYLENDEMARKRQVYNMSSDDENDN